MMSKYSNADEWRLEAMKRPDGVGPDEQQLRRETVRRHFEDGEEQPSEDAMADYELYITGKMELEEYQAYLLFKHGGFGTGEQQGGSEEEVRQ